MGVYLGRKAGEEQLPAPLSLPALPACNELGGLRMKPAAITLLCMQSGHAVRSGRRAPSTVATGDETPMSLHEKRLLRTSNGLVTPLL